MFLASESHPPACAVETLAVETVERQREELNALYVALTRTRHTLAISSITPYREPERSWWARLSGLASNVEPDAPVNARSNSAAKPTPESVATPDAPPCGFAGGVAVAATVAHSARASATGLFYLKELPPVPIGITQEAIKKEVLSGASDAASARRGQAMHRLLEWGNASAANLHAAMREFDLTPELGSEAADMARRILQGEGAWAWDTGLVGWQGNEVELSYQGDTLRLDRLVRRSDTGEWWVLDYKSPHTPQDDPALVSQLQNYRDAVRAIYPHAAVRAAFLTAAGKLVELGMP